MSISHSIIDFLPSMFLGVPDEGTVLSILPGHYFMLQGRGKQAIRLITVGGFGSLLVTIILLPLFAWFLPPIYVFIKPYIYLILISAVMYMLLRLNRDIYSIVWSTFLFTIFWYNGVDFIEHTNIVKCKPSYNVFRTFWGEYTHL